MVNRYTIMMNIIGKVVNVKLDQDYNFIFPIGKDIQSNDVICIMDMSCEKIDPDRYDELCEEFDKKYIIDKNGDIIER